MFLFSCCRQVDTHKGYTVKKKQNDKQTIKYVPSLELIKKEALNDNNIVIQKVQRSDYDQIMKKYKGTNKKWTDMQFPPQPQSLGVIQNLQTSQWKRISDILNKPALFQGKIQPKDVIQGNLGDCYFLSALAALAEDQSRIKDVFSDQQYNQNGIYKVTMRIDGIIQQIIVDDYIPVNSQHQPLFCQANKNQFWVLIMQKAWAKAHGSYANIVAGNPTQVFKAITYAPAELSIVKQSQEERAKLWRTIVNRAAKNNPCCCGTDDRQQQDWDKLNLIPGHAYTLIHAASLYDNVGRQHKMLLLRNPWGATEWQGQGSQDDKQFWSKISNSLDKDVFDRYRNLGNDGIFFITYTDFCRYFSQVHFCLLEKNGNYLSEPLYCDKKHATLYSIEIHKSAEYIFQLHQSGIRGEDDHKIQDGLCRSTLLIAQISGSSYKFIDANMKYNEEDLNLSCYLYPGSYLLYAKLDPTRKFNEIPEKSSVSVYSREFTDLMICQQKQYPNFLQKVFLQYGKQHKRQSYNNDQMWISWKMMFQQGGFAFIGFGNNETSNRKFIINFDEGQFQAINFKLKKPFKGKGNNQVLEIHPGQQKIILARVANIPIKSLKFPPQLGIKMEKIQNNN